MTWIEVALARAEAEQLPRGHVGEYRRRAASLDFVVGLLDDRLIDDCLPLHGDFAGRKISRTQEIQ